jgi:hypothetical protein
MSTSLLKLLSPAVLLMMVVTVEPPSTHSNLFMNRTLLMRLAQSTLLEVTIMVKSALLLTFVKTATLMNPASSLMSITLTVLKNSVNSLVKKT